MRGANFRRPKYGAFGARRYLGRLAVMEVKKGSI